MFTSIFSKILSICIAVLLISFSITGAILFIALDQYTVNQKVSFTTRKIQTVPSTFSTYIENINSPLINYFFKNSIEQASSDTDSIILITDSKGEIYISSELPKFFIKNLNKNGSTYSLPNTKQYEWDTSKQYIKTDDYYGMFKQTNMEWIVIRIPFESTIKTVEGTYKFNGMVFAFAPMPEYRKARSSVFNLFIIASAVALLVTVILTYFLSKRISKPIKEITKVAKYIANGDFEKRLHINTNDEIEELSQSFNQMVDGLENLEKMRKEFVANVSHELRTPITSIKGFVEGVIDGTIPEDAQTYYLSIVRDEAARLARMVKELLDLAKLEAGEFEIKYTSFDINELIRICIINMQNLILDKDIDIKAQFEFENMYVYADEDSIQRVIINLLHNAIKFTKKNGLIRINTKYEKKKIVVSIEDNGEGMSEEDQKYVFDRFHKADKSRSKDKTGVGLGLAIVKNVINSHRQDIWVESKIGEGTKFSFTLDVNLED